MSVTGLSPYIYYQIQTYPYTTTSRYSATHTYRPCNFVKRNSLFHGISVHRHPRYNATNCGVQTVALYRDLSL